MERGSERRLAGIDTGGTFTDLVVIDASGIRQHKVLSTPDDPSRAIARGLREMGLDDRPVIVVHGTTVGTNAVLENKGARVAYITTSGFADVLSLGRQARERVYDLEQAATSPPVPAGLCFEVPTRILADGSLERVASDGELDALLEAVAAQAPESVAINLLFSFLAPEQEQRIARRLKDRYFVSCSSQVLPEPREYERGIATWLDAAVGPLIGRYLGALQQRVPKARISVMQSSGTTVRADQAVNKAVHLLLSGPAGGISAAGLVAAQTGERRLLTLDMGGTSTDVALVDGETPITYDNRIGRWPVGVASVDIHTIGAGGGSIARLDSAGLLLVGPESSGADPGPACYGQGGPWATVTDANLVLGRIPPDTLLGGSLPLDVAAAEAVLDQLAAGLGCRRAEAAEGIVRLANEHMVRALRVISVERGHDPRDDALFCFGGAGGLHACELADLLGMKRIVLPAAGGVLSALGMLASRPGRVRIDSVLEDVGAADDAALIRRFEAMEQASVDELAAEGQAREDLDLERSMSLQYRGQRHLISMPFEPGRDHEAAFHHLHEASVGHRLEQCVELVKLQSRVSGRAPLVHEGMVDSEAGPSPQPAPSSGKVGGVPVYRRSDLSAGSRIDGPAIISESVATSWLAREWSARVDPLGHLRLSRRS